MLFFLPSLDAALTRYREVLAPGGRLGFTWFGERDKRWDPVFGALTADLPDSEKPPRNTAGGPFTSVEAMHTHLEAGGWSDVTTETLTHDVQVRDADHWFEWTWSQGFRFVLENLEARGLLDTARQRVDRLIAELAASAGELRWRAEVHATVARVAPV